MNPQMLIEVMRREIPLCSGVNGVDLEGNALEHNEQKALMYWAARMVAQEVMPELKRLFAIPNGHGVFVGTRVKMWKEGVKSGVPDMELPVRGAGNAKGYTTLNIELKRRHGGEVSDDQEEWAEFLRAEGRAVFFCYGWDSAAWVILWYLGWTNSPLIREDGTKITGLSA